MDMNNIDLKTMMSQLMQNAQKMQETMRQSDKIVTAKAGGDLVIADANMQMQITRLELAPALFAESPGVITELIMAAINSVLQNAKDAMKQEMLEATKKMGGGNFGF